MLRLVALILFGVAALTLARRASCAGSGRSARDRADARRQLLAHRAVLGGVRRELRALQQQTRAAAGRPIMVARGAGRDADRRQLPRRSAGRAARDRPSAADGELRVAGGLASRAGASPSRGRQPRSRWRAVDGQPAASDLHDRADGADRAPRYGRAETLDSGALDDALAAAMRAADRVASQHTWIAEAMALDAAQLVRGWRPQAWAR